MPAGHKGSHAEVDWHLPGMELQGALQDEDGLRSCSARQLLHQPGCSAAEDVRALLGASVWQGLGQS